MKRLTPFFIALCLATTSHARLWTSTSGSKIDAEFVRLEDDKVVLKKKDGKELSVKVSLFSKADQEFIKKSQAKAKPSGKKEVPRHVLFWKDREPTRPNYNDPWPEKAEKLGEIDIKIVKADAEAKQYIYHSPTLRIRLRRSSHPRDCEDLL